jgi:hypothetical protein
MSVERRYPALKHQHVAADITDFAAAVGALGANPSATYGADMTGANGAALTFLRSDAVLKINPGIVPTWTAQHKFTGDGSSFGNWAIVASSLVPAIGLQETDAAADNKIWYKYANGAVLNHGAMNDAASTLRNYLVVARSGVAITALQYGNSTDNPSHTFYGSLTGTAASIDSAMLKDNDGSWGVRKIHATYTTYDTGSTVTHPYGVYHVQGTTNGPGFTSTSQYYNMRLGLGSDYISGASAYGIDLSIGRFGAAGPAVMSTRSLEGGAFGAWKDLLVGGLCAISDNGASQLIYNTATYGNFKIVGSKGGYAGIMLADDSGVNPTFMAGAGAAGVFNQGDGAWAWWRSSASYVDTQYTWRRYTQGAFLWYASSSYQSGSITIQSGGSASGGSDGDIFLIY